MIDLLNNKVLKVIACPICKNQFENVNSINCLNCGFCGKISKKKSIDLRPDRKVKQNLIFDVNLKDYSFPNIKLDFLKENNNNTLHKELKIPHHMTKELLSHFPIAQNNNSIALDLGCGKSIHKEIIEKFGYNYVGIDGFIDGADILGDAHCLPFLDNSFDFILSIAVFEHILYPHVMIKEIERVLKPGGILIGTVAFLEPFHEDSFFHHSQLGIISLLNFAQLEIDIIAPSKRWNSLLASLNMGFFPKIPMIFYKPIVKIIYLASQVYWKLASQINKSLSVNDFYSKITGSFAFIAKKTNESTTN